MSLRHPRPLVLASSSPRRAALLREAGYEFEVVPPPVHEPPADHAYSSVEGLAEALAYFKVRSVEDLRPEATLLAADTLVAGNDEIIGKPRDAVHAREILQSLGGTRHQVVTGVAIIGPGGQPRMIRHAVSTLIMRPMSSGEIDAYIASREWEGKAGAYAIQESGDRFVSIESGSLTNVVGLPMELLADMWRDWHKLGAAVGV